MELTMEEALAAQLIGEDFLRFARQSGYPLGLLPKIESKAVQALEDIRQALNNETLDDPECFQRIESIIRAYESHGPGTIRHDW